MDAPDLRFGLSSTLNDLEGLRDLLAARDAGQGVPDVEIGDAPPQVLFALAQLLLAAQAQDHLSHDELASLLQASEHLRNILHESGLDTLVQT